MSGLIVGLVLIALLIAGAGILFAVLYMNGVGRQTKQYIKQPGQFAGGGLSPQYDKTSNVLVFADLPSSNFEYTIANSYKVSLETAIALAKDVFDNPVGSFIGFQSNNRIVQFVKEEGDNVTVDVPAVGKGGSYQKTITSTIELSFILTAFYEERHIPMEFDLVFQSHK